MPFWLYGAVSGGGVSLAFQGLANSQVSYLPEAHWRSDDCEDPSCSAWCPLWPKMNETPNYTASKEVT